MMPQGMPQGMPPVPGGEKGGMGQGQPGPNEIKQQLVMMLTQMKKMASENGIDWNSVLAEVEGKKSKGSETRPQPPSPPMVSPLG